MKNLRAIWIPTAVALSALGALADSASAGTIATRAGTCLNRSSDGFNGCWRSGYTPIPNNRNAFVTVSCTSYTVRYDGDTPANQHGVPRTNAIAVQLVSDHNGATAINGWAGLGGTINTPLGNSATDIENLEVYLGMQNSYAQIHVTPSGPADCAWAN